MMEEKDLISRAARDDADAFRQLVETYQTPAYRLAARMCGPDGAEDVTQEAFLAAWRGLPQFRGDCRFSTWLYRIAINEALDFLRKKKQATQVSADDEPGIASRLLADEYFDGDEIQAHLQEAVALLPDVQRTVFTLKYFDNMKYSEISKILSTSEGALKASYHLAVKKITEFLQKY